MKYRVESIILNGMLFGKDLGFAVHFCLFINKKKENMSVTPSEVSSFFDISKSTIYDQQIRQSIPGYDAMHKMVYAMLAESLKPDAHILVAGAGTGMELLAMGTKQQNWRFTAFDISAEMLAVCTHALASCAMQDRVNLLLGSVDAVPDEVQFDAGTSLLVSHFIADINVRQHYFSTIASRLVSGGLFFCADLVGDISLPYFAEFKKAWFRFNVENGRDYQELIEGMNKSDKVVTYLPESEYCRILEVAGFDITGQFFRGLLFSGWLCKKR